MSDRVLHIFQFGPYQLNADEKLLLRDGEEVPVKPKVVDTLIVLIRNRGHVVSKAELLQTLWPDSFVEESNLTHNISLLRKVLEEKESGQNYIQTVPKRGYRFVAEVEESFKQIEDTSATGVATNVATENDVIAIDRAAQASHRTRFNYKIVVACICLTALLGAGLYFFFSRQRAGKAASNSVRLIAVVPFKVVGDGSSDEFLGLGMADSLIYRLNSLPQLSILPTSSIARFTGREHDARDVGKRLMVDAVLEGTVQHTANRVLVTASLIDLRNGNTLWTGKFDEQFTDIFILQDSISEKVARALEIQFGADRKDKLATRFTNSTEAYQLYSIGIFHWNKRTAEGLQKALELFHLATEKDPKFALAFAALADVYMLIDYYNCDFLPPKEPQIKAEEMARKALELDGNLAEAHGAMGAVYARFMERYATAETFYKRAIELRPYFGTVYVRYGYLLIALGKIDEALRNLHLARELDPLSATILTNIAACYLYTRKPAEAVKYSKLALEIEPDFYHALDNLASAYMYQGMYNEAEGAFRRMAALDRARLFGAERLAFFFAYVGRRDEAQKSLNEVLKRREERTAEGSPPALAQVYAALGEKEQAISVLNSLSETNQLYVYDLRYNQDYDSLRSETSFQNVLQREEMKILRNMK